MRLVELLKLGDWQLHGLRDERHFQPLFKDATFCHFNVELLEHLPCASCRESIQSARAEIDLGVVLTNDGKRCARQSGAELAQAFVAELAKSAVGIVRVVDLRFDSGWQSNHCAGVHLHH